MDEYEARGRDPQRVLEMIACLVRENNESHGRPLKAVDQIKLVVQMWEWGERLDLDALESIFALTRQLRNNQRFIAFFWICLYARSRRGAFLRHKSPDLFQSLPLNLLCFWMSRR